MSDLTVQGQSVQPCFFGICKATMFTGQFHITGPVIPVLKVLEEAAAAKTCELIEDLPDISFLISGSRFTMTHGQYVPEPVPAQLVL